MSDEIKLNSANGIYDPAKANAKSHVRRKYSKFQGMKIVQNSELQKFVETELYHDQSPANIAGRIQKHEKHLVSASKDSIYRYIKSVYGRRVEVYRRKRKTRRWRRSRAKGEKLKDRTFIDKRPQFINRRLRIGDAEADFIVSGKTGKGIILNVTDRKSRAPFLEQIIEVTTKNVELAFKRIKKRFPELKTITTDNDILLRFHKRLEKILGVKIYFCRPFHSWEKGTVENANGYVRKDIPKGSDISKYSKRFIRRIEEKLQRRFMDCLDHLTPLEVIEDYRETKNARRR
ncbi:MAG: IS30 family transposase [bacterium]|nr:IS30 family transposase [bacterium]